ncbi:hypothetical protein IW146_007973 [Coemansia sp. RSA 922]|nr:hypothetical protein GGI14_006306 [Coemansia sp. S680]KAJ2035906.1 hypothetical protein H4S03_003992 [Coemansia sp. S3946]KAJ2044195.1 hypothetical protein H4S04_006345 [Coemansia sp. S16]KAJ2077475.1 hypothetical protein GGI09_008211 [Coemansia sp. S100]KAJ2090721.1 hypothetical protein GGI16_006098 [Coemansia sp. S142-1]KAJ2106023.1 hypothetical protein IW146_007973 [Coemansia sp. RSA 922]
MLKRQAKKCEKDEKTELANMKKDIAKGNTEQARIRAENVIRKKNEGLNLMKLSSRVDAVASRVQTAVTMRQVTGAMTSVVRGLEKNMKNMNLEQMSLVMDTFETQFEDLDVQTGYMEGTIGEVTAKSTPQNEIDLLMRQVADESGLELKDDMQELPVPQEEVGEEALLNERLHRLRNAV